MKVERIIPIEIIENGGRWIATAEEHGIVGQGSTRSEAIIAVREALQQTIGPCQVRPEILGFRKTK